jgi:hypothetical protein
VTKRETDKVVTVPRIPMSAWQVEERTVTMTMRATKPTTLMFLLKIAMRMLMAISLFFGIVLYNLFF